MTSAHPLPAGVMALPFRKDLDKYKDLDEDEILGKLSEEELKQLETVLDDLDPEVCIRPTEQVPLSY
ncbi:hypothetical protein JD844_014417 [Phrynosoma platyrhinos]|uniref:Tropomodulin n=1 Tax=Phrynosoma platyrhinos TaxID=52577 RepID=A0ABQ7SRM8_PHRPL|nr:hypothetical protein JD844_014417 [Phrynosoma platyrhinos]